MPSETSKPSEPRMIPWKFLLAPIVGNPDSISGVTELQPFASPMTMPGMTELEGAVPTALTTVPIGYPVPETISPFVTPRITVPSITTLLGPCTAVCDTECLHIAFIYSSIPNVASEWLIKRGKVGAFIGDIVLVEFGRPIADYLDAEGGFPGNKPRWPKCVELLIPQNQRKDWSWTRAKEALRQLLTSTMPSTTYVWQDPIITDVSEQCLIKVKVCSLIVSLVPDYFAATTANKAVYNFPDSSRELGAVRLEHFLKVVERGVVGMAVLRVHMLCKILEKWAAQLGKQGPADKDQIQRLARQVASSVASRWDKEVADYRKDVESLISKELKRIEPDIENLSRKAAKAAVQAGANFVHSEGDRWGFTQEEKNEVWGKTFLEADIVENLESDKWGECPRKEITPKGKVEPKVGYKVRFKDLYGEPEPGTNVIKRSKLPDAYRLLIHPVIEVTEVPSGKETVTEIKLDEDNVEVTLKGVEVENFSVDVLEVQPSGGRVFGAKSITMVVGGKATFSLTPTRKLPLPKEIDEAEWVQKFFIPEEYRIEGKIRVRAIQGLDEYVHDDDIEFVYEP